MNRLSILIFVIAALAGGPAGAWETGHRLVSFADPARGGRSVPTDVYYPADAPGEEVPVAAAPEGGFPVVAFGHGFLIAPSYYAWVWQGLVPAGFVVALPRTEGGLLPSHAALGADLAFVAARMRAEGESPGSPFFGRIAAVAGVAGHSMGGGASLLAAAADPALAAVANLAAAETSPSAVAAAGAIVRPALLFSGSNDCVTPPAQHQLPMYGALASTWKTHVSLTGASHCQFADAGSLCGLGEGGCPSPTLSRAQQQALVLDLLRPWLEFTLKGEREGWRAFQTRLTASSAVTWQQAGAPTGVGTDGLGATDPEARIALEPGRPNPFGATVVLRFRAGEAGRATLAIHSLDGRRVRALADIAATRGWVEAVWDGRDAAGRPVAAGVYLARLRTAEATRVQRLLLVR